MTIPVRLQLSRRIGFNLQTLSQATNGLPAAAVARPGKWGNPWSVHGARDSGYRGADAEIQAHCVQLFREWITLDARSDTRFLEKAAAPLNRALPDLRGKNLACWCKPSAPCHAEVLLELANSPACEAVD